MNQNLKKTPDKSKAVVSSTIMCVWIMGRIKRWDFKEVANAEVPKKNPKCILSFVQQGPPKLVARK